MAAKAFKQWLCSVEWIEEDIFLDLDDIDAGERWKEALKRASSRCEAVILLASPDSLASAECIAEVRRAEDYGKELIVALLRDLTVEDPRLSRFNDRQIVDLRSSPLNHTEVVIYLGKQHTVNFNQTALKRVESYLQQRGLAPDHFGWPPSGREGADPFPGLSSFDEEEAGIFFGRESDILRGLDRMRVLRRDGRPGFCIIQAASGSGKSSFLRAGLWPRLKRDPDFAPLTILRPATGILAGSGGLSEALSSLLSKPGHAYSAGKLSAQLLAEDNRSAQESFISLIDELSKRLLERRSQSGTVARRPLLVLAVDQAEGLLSRDHDSENQRFLELVQAAMSKDRSSSDLLTIFTVRSDKAIGLIARLSTISDETPEIIPLLPLLPSAYRELIKGPLRVLERRGKKVSFDAEVIERLTAETRGADALPLLAFSVSNLYRDFGVAGSVTLADFEMTGGTTGTIIRALQGAFAQPTQYPSISESAEERSSRLEAAFVPWLARIDPDTGEPLRRIARYADFPQDTLPYIHRLVEARILVADRREDEEVVEIAHESILRQWPDLRFWLERSEADLKLLDKISRSAKEWDNHGRLPGWLDHRGKRLTEAEKTSRKPLYFGVFAGLMTDYLRACRFRERSRLASMVVVSVAMLSVLGLGTFSWLHPVQVMQMVFRATSVWPYQYSLDNGIILKAGQTLQECRGCPIMVAIPPGQFSMGSPVGLGDPTGREQPVHRVDIRNGLMVSQTAITYLEWDTCVTFGPCQPVKAPWGTGRHPAVNVSWYDGITYSQWLSDVTGSRYRLLSESEYEYATRAGSNSSYPWGSSFVKDTAACGECNRDGSVGDGTVDVGSFPANNFGLYDMVGNAASWVEDCFHADYKGSPSDGSPWLADGCLRRVVRGGSWLSRAIAIRSASRDWLLAGSASDALGFRIGRMANH